MFTFIVVVSVLAIFVVAGLYANAQEKKRRDALQKLAGDLGLEYSEVLSEDDKRSFGRFPLASRGRNQVISSVIIAETGDRRMALFDYRYVTGSGKSRKTHHLACLLCRSPLLRIPALSLEPSSWSSKIATFFGGQDIRIEGHIPFSERYRLRGPNAEEVERFWTPERCSRIMELPSELMEGNGDAFILYRKYKHLTADAVHGLLRDGLAMSEVLGIPVASEAG